MQYIVDLKIEDERRSNYKPIKGYKASWTNHINSYVLKCSYTGIEYLRERGNRHVKISAFHDRYKLRLWEFGRYDRCSILGMIDKELWSTDLDDLIDTANLFIDKRMDI